jgi:hypothetical protein
MHNHGASYNVTMPCIHERYIFAPENLNAHTRTSRYAAPQYVQVCKTLRVDPAGPFVM